MAVEVNVGCASPPVGLVGDKIESNQGKKVPDFTAPAYHNNTFTNEKLTTWKNGVVRSGRNGKQSRPLSNLPVLNL